VKRGHFFTKPYWKGEHVMAPLQSILIADDDELLRTTISNILVSAGYETITAEDGLQAYDLIRRVHNKVKLVITDIRMPRMSGVELTERLRNEFPELKILCISGYTDRLRFKGHYFLAKPFTSSALRAIVQEVIPVAETSGCVGNSRTLYTTSSGATTSGRVG
jgi:CheY-like chemotaxis protein